MAEGWRADPARGRVPGIAADSPGWRNREEAEEVNGTICTMRSSTTRIAVACCPLAFAVVCTGCALVSDVHEVSGATKEHTIVVFGVLPIWHTVRPVDTPRERQEPSSCD